MEIDIENENFNKDQSCQTDEDLIYSYAWSKYYQHFINYYNSTTNSAQNISDHKTNDIAQDENQLKIDKLDAESIRQIAEISLESKGLLYDSKSGFYYDTQNDLYYDQRSNKNIPFEVPFKDEKKKWKLICKLIKEEEKSTNEEENKITDESSSEEMFIDHRSKYPPCIRAILIEFNSEDYQDLPYELGSLFLIPYTGGSIGSAKSNLINFESLSEIQNVHASFNYDTNENKYYVKDQNSNIGTFLNDNKLESNINIEIKHNDKLWIGKKICLLLHIHEGSNTCINCEPGEVMHKLKLEKENAAKSYDKKSKEEIRKENVKLIKKKYGIKGEPIQIETGLDRAKQRRGELGIDYSHIEATKNQVTMDKKIDENNIGLKMLSKMGWKEGKGLGKTESGITEPVSTKIKLDKSGVGAEEATCSMNVDEKQKRKIINWNKTKERFQSVQDPKLSTVFNDDEDE